jgi:hypothetical protein
LQVLCCFALAWSRWLSANPPYRYLPTEADMFKTSDPEPNRATIIMPVVV